MWTEALKDRRLEESPLYLTKAEVYVYSLVIMYMIYNNYNIV